MGPHFSVQPSFGAFPVNASSCLPLTFVHVIPSGMSSLPFSAIGLSEAFSYSSDPSSSLPSLLSVVLSLYYILLHCAKTEACLKMSENAYKAPHV